MVLWIESFNMHPNPAEILGLIVLAMLAVIDECSSGPHLVLVCTGPFLKLVDRRTLWTVFN